MEILNNTNLICCFITFILGAMFMLSTLAIASMTKVKEPRNKVHFYVARDKNGRLYLYLCKPIRGEFFFLSCYKKCGKCMASSSELAMYGLNKNDYKDLKWEDEPVEVFVNMENN